MFNKFIINYEQNLFDELSTNIEFEDIIKGRQGANLINNENNLVPLVRTTTNYTKPTQQFLSIHYKIIKDIQKINKNIELNNALIEIYDSNYKTMRYHSDQAIDLENNSYICIFSCYDNLIENRKLQIKNKNDNCETEILLEHNSVIIFDTNTNFNFLHKIILNDNISNNKWLGITFRLSKTFIEFRKNADLFIPYFISNDKKLTLANDKEKTEFFKYKGTENSNSQYQYPEIYYTISIGDLLNIRL
jgi:hypothetical protein